MGLFSWLFGRGAPPAVQLRPEGSRGHFEVAGEYYNQDALKGHEGHHVAVTGHIKGDSIHVESVKML